MLYAATSPPRLWTLIPLTALSVLSLNMFLPSLSNMAADFAADYALLNVSIAGYLAGTAVLQLVMGPLSDRYGRRPVILAGVAIFTLASLVCALTTNVWVFLVFRVAQGAIICGWALSLAVVRDMAPPREAASVMGYLSMAMAVAPMLGPMIGGALDELFGWRASFVVYIGLGALAWVLCWVDLGETHGTRSETFTTQFQAYPELLRSRRFWGYVVCMGFSTGAFYAFLSGAPLVAETVLELSPGMLGFYMGTITAGFFVGSFLSGRHAKRFAPTTMMIAGRIVACSGLLLGLMLFLAGIVTPLSVFGATVFVGIGNGITMPSANVGAVSVRRDLVGSAAGLSGAMMIGAGAVLASITGSVLTAGNAAFGLVGMMLLCSLTGLAAALFVLRLERREGRARLATPGH